MHAYYRNHQLYLAEKCRWLDKQVAKNSQRALMKIESYKMIVEAEDPEQTQLIKKLVNDSLLTTIHNRSLLKKEGFYRSNLDN